MALLCRQTCVPKVNHLHIRVAGYTSRWWTIKGTTANTCLPAPGDGIMSSKLVGTVTPASGPEAGSRYGVCISPEDGT